MLDYIKNLPWDDISFSEWVQIGIGCLTLLATIIVTLLIYFLQRKHEKEINRLHEEQRKADLVNQADQFLIKYADETGFLPWCVIATQLHRHEQHSRPIYTDFCKCSDELQLAILERANQITKGLTGKLDIMRWIDSIKVDIETYQFGRNVLYDNAKYLSRTFWRYRDELIGDKLDERVVNPIVKNVWIREMLPGDKRLTIAEYIDEYFYYFISAPEGTEMDEAPTPPIDFVWENMGLADAPEKDACMWITELVTGISMVIHNSNTHPGSRNSYLFSHTGAQPETFEDAYYQALQWLSYAYNDFDPKS